MIYLILFFSLMLFFVIKIEKKIIGSKYLIKRAHKYRHQTRKERVERRKEIEEYKKSLTHKYYVDKNLKDPEIKRMLDKNRLKNLDAFRFEARLFYYGFVISILFGFIFTITGLYQDEFIRSLYPYIQPYFKVFYSNFDRYTFNPLSFKVCFSWVLVFSVLMGIYIGVYIVIFSKKFITDIERTVETPKDKFKHVLLCGFSIWMFFLFFQDSDPGFYGERALYRLPYSYGMYFMFILCCFAIALIALTICKKILFDMKKGKSNAN